MALTKTKKSVIDVSTIIGGSQGHVQFNNNSDFGTADELYWDNTNKELITEAVRVGEIGSGQLINPYGNGPKNLIINSNFNLWQRGVTITNIYTGTSENQYLADRWSVYNNSVPGINATFKRNTDNPTDDNTISNYCLELYNSSNFAVTSDYHVGIQYKSEGIDIVSFMKHKCTLSFYVKSNATGTYCVSLRMYDKVTGDYEESIVSEYTVLSSGSWEKKTITFDMSGFDTTNIDFIGNTTAEGKSLSIFFTLSGAVGSVFSTNTTDSVESGDFKHTDNQTNMLSTAGQYLRLSQVQFERGVTATPLEFVPFQDEVARCQRYYSKSYDLDEVPGSTNNNRAFHVFGWTSGYVWYVNFCYQYPVAMRDTPTVTGYHPLNGTSGKFQINSQATPEYNFNPTYRNSNGFSTNTVSVAGGQKYYVQWTADAELY